MINQAHAVSKGGIEAASTGDLSNHTFMYLQLHPGTPTSSVLFPHLICLFIDAPVTKTMI